MASGRVNVLRGREVCAYVKDEYNHHRYGNKGTMDRKRKVAPTVMDQDVKKVRLLSEGKVQTLHSCSPVKYESGDSNLSERSAISYSPPSPMEMGEIREGERLEDGECFETRDILMSRWSSGSESPADSCVSDIEDMAKRKGIARQKNVCETHFVKQQIPSSEGEEEYSDDILDKNDDTEIDEKYKVEDDLLSEDEKTGYENQVCPLPKRSVNMLHSCRNVFEYERLDKISEGAYGVVFKAKDKKSGEIVALKKVKMGGEKEGGFPLSALREINILMSIHDPSIVNVKEVVMGGIDDVFMVMEYMEHDLKRTLEVMKYPFSVSEVKCLMLQLLKGVKYLHDNWVIHRDLKSSNLLLNNMGEMKICDFGLSRQYGSHSKQYTQLVVTLWYRAPELLLQSKQYSTAIDMWSVGCIMAEMLRKEPLFKGKGEVDQLEKIFRTLGTPNESTWPGFSKLPGSSAKYARQPFNQLRKIFPATSFTGSPALSEAGFDLLTNLLTYNPEQRITAEDALNHEWFYELPLPKSKEFMPTFPVQNEHSRHGSR